MWVSIIYNETSLCINEHQYRTQRAMRHQKCLRMPRPVCMWTSHSTVLFFKFNPCNRWLHYRGFTLAPCDVSLAMLSLNHRIVRLMIDMLLHSYMHRWKNNLLRLRVRVQLVLGGLACINTIALQSVKDRLTAWTHEVVTNKRSESVHLT